MNKTEQRYAEYLSGLIRVGEILRFDFEPVKLRLAKSTFYTPDFRVVTVDHYIQYHEVKGFWRDDARVKIKCAAEKHDCYQFIAIQWVAKKKEWSREHFGWGD
jgi:hypothetical protein